MKKIIVATDYSAEAENALQYAASMAVELQYELILFSLQNASIHVLNARLPASSLNAHLTAKKEYLKAKAKQIKEELGINVSAYFATGVFFDQLKQCITDTRADMLVMGMAPQSLEQDLIGNTTTSAIHRLQIPVLAVPIDASYNGINLILFACNTTRGVHQQVLAKVHDLAEVIGAQVEIFNVLNTSKESARYNREEMDDALAGVVHYYNNVISDDVVSAIKEEIIAQKADLLIMVPYKYGFWNSLVHKSKTSTMASASSIPLLSIHL